MTQYRELTEDEINRELFSGFCRRQVVSESWRYLYGHKVIRKTPFIDDWSEEEYELLVRCLKNTVRQGGFVYAAFSEGILKGFVSVEPEIFHPVHRYMDLSSIHVSEDMRGLGIGKTLFSQAKAWARAHGAKKLYISAHSSVESQSFYKAMGCVEASVYHRQHALSEPCDCQLECVL